MKIINPLYDKVFKYLVENDQYARKVLSIILDTEIVELSLGQQETVAPDEKRQLTLFRAAYLQGLVEDAAFRRQLEA